MSDNVIQKYKSKAEYYETIDAMFADGKTIAEIADAMGKQYDIIRRQLGKIGWTYGYVKTRNTGKELPDVDIELLNTTTLSEVKGVSRERARQILEECGYECIWKKG